MSFWAKKKKASPRSSRPSGSGPRSLSMFKIERGTGWDEFPGAPPGGGSS